MAFDGWAGVDCVRCGTNDSGRPDHSRLAARSGGSRPTWGCLLHSRERQCLSGTSGGRSTPLQPWPHLQNNLHARRCAEFLQLRCESSLDGDAMGLGFPDAAGRSAGQDRTYRSRKRRVRHSPGGEECQEIAAAGLEETRPCQFGTTYAPEHAGVSEGTPAGNRNRFLPREFLFVELRVLPPAVGRVLETGGLRCRCEMKQRLGRRRAELPAHFPILTSKDVGNSYSRLIIANRVLARWKEGACDELNMPCAVLPMRAHTLSAIRTLQVESIRLEQENVGKNRT